MVLIPRESLRRRRIKDAASDGVSRVYQLSDNAAYYLSHLSDLRVRPPLAALGARTPAFSRHRLGGCQAAQAVPCELIEVLIGELIILLSKYGSVHTGCKALRLLGNRRELPHSRRTSFLLQRKLWCGQ